MQKKYFYLIAITTLVLIFDQLTKIYVHTHFSLGESYTIINGYFDFTYVRNYGAAWGIFSESNEVFRKIFFLSIPPIAVGFIIYLLRSVENSDKFQITALSLIASGALGNYIDRIRFSYVIDFIDVHIKRIYSYPVFNIADCAIVIGVMMMLYYIVFLEEKVKNKQLQELK